jgi:hypothetical protein
VEAGARVASVLTQIQTDFARSATVFELCMRGVDRLYRGKRVATSRTSTENVPEREY